MYKYQVILTPDKGNNSYNNGYSNSGLVEAIKAYMFLTNKGLKESKEAVESFPNFHDFIVMSSTDYTYEQIAEYIQRQYMYKPAYRITINKPLIVQPTVPVLKIVQNGSTYSVEINHPNIVVKGNFSLDMVKMLLEKEFKTNI